jgi:type IV pilus assembly protein PilY1
MLYVGANDGMLHGFEAGSGNERLAYIPRGIAEGPLRKLSDTNYSHQYMVDGSPFTGDALTGGATKTWKTVLVGSLGAGGRGYFVLDVTNPANFTTSMSTTAVADFVLTDMTASTDADIGHMVSPPAVDDASANRSSQIVKLNNNRWAVVMGNGVNSTNEAPVLLIQYLDEGRELVKLSPCVQPIATTVSASSQPAPRVSPVVPPIRLRHQLEKRSTVPSRPARAVSTSPGARTAPARAMHAW